jgi:hypothetical protein
MASAAVWVPRGRVGIWSTETRSPTPWPAQIAPSGPSRTSRATVVVQKWQHSGEGERARRMAPRIWRSRSSDVPRPGSSTAVHTAPRWPSVLRRSTLVVQNRQQSRAPVWSARTIALFTLSAPLALGLTNRTSLMAAPTGRRSGAHRYAPSPRCASARPWLGPTPGGR